MIFDRKLQNTIVSIMTSTAVVIILAFGVIVASPQRASAAPGDPCNFLDPKYSFLTLPAWYKYLPGTQEGTPKEDGTYRCSPNLGGDTATEEEQVNTSLAIGVAVLEGILRASTFVAVIMIFWGAFKYITTQGNADNATKARQTVINAVIGFAIVLVASQVVAYIGRTLVT